MTVTADPFYTLTLNFRDRELNNGSMQLYIAPSVLIADIVTAIGATIQPAISLLSDASFVGWSINRSARDDAEVLAPEASDVQRKGTFSFQSANLRPVTLKLPSIKNTLVIDRSNKINIADAGVAAFIDMMTAGTLLGALRPTSVTGSNITVFKDARKTHRASSEG